MANYTQFLKSSLTNYKHRDIAQHEVETACSNFSDLRPKLEDFYFHDGGKKNLLKLEGTIPVTYKGSTYNIPICIWLTDIYPYNPPLVYVQPTNKMQIKVGRHVDKDGKVDLPYLREWKYPKSDIADLIQILLIVFGEDPPLFSKTSNDLQQQNLTSFKSYLETLRIAKYKHPDVAERDVIEVFRRFIDLKPVMQDFVYKRGVTKRFLELRGFMEVKSGEALFGVPISVVVLDTYPDNPPLVYVYPSSSVLINVGKNIDTSGKVHLTYLNNWKYPSSNLLGLLQVMTIVFGEEPPIRPRILLPDSMQDLSTTHNTSSRRSLSSSNLTQGSDNGYLASEESLHGKGEFELRRGCYPELQYSTDFSNIANNTVVDHTGLKLPSTRHVTGKSIEETDVKSQIIGEDLRMLELGEKLQLDDETCQKYLYITEGPQMLLHDEKNNLNYPSNVRGMRNQDKETNIKTPSKTDNSRCQLNQDTELKISFYEKNKYENRQSALSPSPYEYFVITTLCRYKYPEEAKVDIMAIFNSYANLRPKVDDYVFNDGVKKYLLKLDGTIPVYYKGSTYNIPICIWLMDTHPYNPPLVYVRPTANMQIKVGRNVDQDGKIYLPYLQKWGHPRTDLLGLVKILTLAFGDDIPLYSKTP